MVEPHLVRRSHHKADPVYDFLFEYYSFRPSYLRKWSPGFGVTLENATIIDFPQQDNFVATPEGLTLGVHRIEPHFADRTRWIRDMLIATQERPAHFGCFGLHEWAMLYRTTDPRHAHVKLRVSPSELATVVENGPMNCTHFDAFRFFTPQAKPLNAKPLTRDDMNLSEQRGCLHANMDVYRWAFKRYPWISSNLIMDAFELAMEIRLLDMAASPYDLLEEGVKPVRIETLDGRSEYLEQQKSFSDRAYHLRATLIEAYDGLLKALYPTEESFANNPMSS